MGFFHGMFVQPSSELLGAAVLFSRFFSTIIAMGLTLAQALLFGLESYIMFGLTTVALLMHMLLPYIWCGVFGRAWTKCCSFSRIGGLPVSCE